MSFRSPRIDGLAVSPDAPGGGTNPAALPIELQAANFWGRWATPDTLPNATGNAAGDPAYSCMLPGDQAFVQSTGFVYRLINRGTLAGSDAVWLPDGGTLPLLRMVTTPTGADYYSGPAGVAGGATSFVLGFWLRYENAGLLPSGAVQTFVAQNISAGPGRGWRLTWNFPTLRFEAHDGANVFNGANVRGYLDVGAAFVNASYVPARDMVLICRGYQNGGVLTIDAFGNGTRLSGPFAFANAGMAASPGSMQVGGAVGGMTAMQGGILGVAYYEGTITGAQIVEYSDQALGIGNLIEAPWGWGNLWSAKDNEPGATWAPTIGADSLTRNGSPVNVNRYLRAA